jgi:O-antigen/teichoic acid export membrane protein
MGTSIAHMKYFAEYRVRNPQRAIQYAQFFVWWQALTGALQVALVVGVAGTLMPKSAYALYTWAVITHTFIQIPGFYRLFTDAFSGIQRSDYGTILDMGINLLFPMIAQPIVVSLLVWWGQNNPIFGLAMGGVMGLGLAAYVSEVMSFSFGWYLYRRLGYNSRLLLMAHFSKEVAWDSLKLGFFLFLSGLLGGLGSSLNVLVIQSRLFNNNEVLGNLSLANSFVFAFTVFQALTGAMMPSISEAISNGRKLLAQYYASNGYKYGGMVSGFICSILLAVADRFILGSSGPSFERAAVYVVPMLLTGAMQFASWNADCVMYGAGKTRLVTVLSVIDLILSLGLSLALVDRFQAFGLLAVPFVTVPIKIILGYLLNHRFCFPQKFFFWQSLAAPLLAGGTHYLVVRGLTGLIWQQDELTSIIILVIALIPSYPLYSFLYGWFGGWDANTLEVFDRGTRLTSFMRPFTRLFYHASALGARFSPLHDRFPFTNHAAAIAEAQSLTQERVKL